MITPGQVKTGLKNPKKALRYFYHTSSGGGSSGDEFTDLKTYRELLWLYRLYEMVDEVPGHIVELGVGPGTNAVRFGNLVKLHSDEDVRKYYGFDTFGGYTPEDIESTPHLDSNAWEDLDVFEVRETLEQYGVNDLTVLIEGDLKETISEWLSEPSSNYRSPDNLHLALLYIDCNSYLAAKEGIEQLAEYVSPGGIICVDELRQGGETKALRQFCEERDLPFKKGSSPITGAPYTVVEE